VKAQILVSVLILVLMIGITPSFADISDSLDHFYSYDIQTGELAIMWLGYHPQDTFQGYASAGFLLKTTDHVIAIDPSSLLLDYVDSLESLDVIFITHDHKDHFDTTGTMEMQLKTDSDVVADTTSFNLLTDLVPEENLVRILADEQMTVSGITVKALEAEHPSPTPLVYLIELDGFRIFHGSDSGFVEELKNIEKRAHVALVPTGDPSPSAGPQLAFEMIKAVRPDVAIPMHGLIEQMHFFSELVNESELGTTATLPIPLGLMVLSQETMVLETIPEPEPKIPEWVRNIFIWYGEDQISEDELIAALQFLVQEGIIKV
jgi:L-ascorbate metabolism protein UlaG (beta-lactamase superfamily)